MKLKSWSVLAFGVAAGCAGAVEPSVLLDRSFGQEGIALLREPSSLSRSSIRAVRIAADGAIFVGGTHNGDFVVEPYVLKLDDHGHVEPTFGTNGLFSLPLDMANYPGATMGDIALFGDGRIAFVAGLLEDDGSFLARTTSLIGRLTAKGQLDTNWADTGYRRFDFVESIYGLTFGHRGVLAVDGSDRVHLSNRSGTGTNGIARFRTDGTLDPGYGTNGIAWLPEGVALERIRLDGAGRLWGAGPAVSATIPPRLASMRLLSDGQLDTSYGGGMILSDVASTLHEAVVPGSLAFDREGRPLVGFAVEDWKAIQVDTLDVARYTSAGGLDHSFNAEQQHGSVPGIARIALGGAERPNVYAEPLADSGVLAIGHITWIRDGVTISRLHADGATDLTLPNAPDGYPPTLPLLGHGDRDVVMASETDAAGRVVMAGVTHDGTWSCLFVLRLIGDRLFAHGQDPSERPTSCPTP